MNERQSTYDHCMPYPCSLRGATLGQHLLIHAKYQGSRAFFEAEFNGPSLICLKGPHGRSVAIQWREMPLRFLTIGVATSRPLAHEKTA